MFFTPWGISDISKPYFPGVTFYSTPSHGGFKVSKKRLAEMPECLRNTKGWYEEDCEAVKVYVAFKSEFAKVMPNTDRYERAVESLCNNFPDEYAVLFGRYPTADESLAVRDREFAARTRDMFVVRSAWGSWQQDVPEGKVGVLARKESTGAEKWFLVPAALYDTRQGSFVIDDHADACEEVAKFTR